jgi:inorganic triphosphatase YgiF
MARELEIKLSMAQSELDRARAWLLGQPDTAQRDTLQLANTYYDTPEGDLNRQKIALRIRRMGDQYIQTLKTRGEFVNGAHQRQEWEWPLMGTRLQMGLIADTPVAQSVNFAELQPVFGTNFERRVVMIGQGESLIEVAIDSGAIIAGGQSCPLHEIEFELKAGDASSLLAWARRLADEVPVFLNVISKAEQGYYLAGVPSPQPDPASIGSIYDFFYCLSACWLRRTRFPAGNADFSMVRHAAAATGVKADLEKLVDQLSSDRPVNALIAGGLPGRVQLALAGFSPA